MITIKNDKIIAEISEKAAEVYSFKKIGEDYSYSWNGDPKYWKGRNPILFPQVSSTDNKTVLIDGNYYPMGNHGFARNSTFHVDSVSTNEVTLSLNENEETLKQYPFKFKLIVNYKLVDYKLIISYSVKNCGDINMPHGFGLHPAFNCIDGYVDTKIVFDKEEVVGKELIINQELFKKYPTVEIENPKSTKASLISGDKKITVSYDGFKILAIWSNGPFVCIEPWMNLTEQDHNIEMKDRKNINILEPNGEFNINYSWELD